ncbi:O-methyltransferase [Scytonema hofmannii FACHB-248]|uniref:O-methyltransferase n=1 Tax=Scytonema hofmannii FACHB-248 TaxID=1842502 RepID=A0ABR8GT07_9CYAN|nr:MULTISPECIES: O-methyltransferase [Nostocales]MBD2606581.1 O-methyltransferase [Scytonema hofmannii FACHB-248]DAZ89850.1 TPA: CybJ [Tolypothrix sp. PCC 9009]
MELQVVNLLTELEARLRVEESQSPKENPFTTLSPEELDKLMSQLMLAVGPETGKFLNMLLKMQGGKRILDIGTSFGYSTLWLAEAARVNGGHVITLEYVNSKQAQAIEHIHRAGLQNVVDFKLGDAVALLETLPGPWDFVLIDLWKDLYIPCFDHIYEKLSPGAIVIADNISFPVEFRETMKAYQQHVRSKPNLDSVEVGVGHGLELTRKRSDIS